MKRELRVLLVEDLPADVELIRRELDKIGMEVSCHHVDTREAFLRELSLQKPDIILSDHGTPGFRGPAALELARERVPDVPFLMVTGADQAFMEESQADGNISKHCLNQLAPTVRQVLANRALRFQARQVQVSLRKSQDRLEAIGFQQTRETFRANDSGPPVHASFSETFDDLDDLFHAAVRQIRRLLREVDAAMEAAAQKAVVLTSDGFAEMASAGKTAEKMVDDLAACQRVGQVAICPMPVRMAEVVRQIMIDAVAEHPERQIEWVVRPLPEIVADPTLVEEALRALTGYALAQTRRESPARIDIACEQSEAEVRVALRYDDSHAVKTRSQQNRLPGPRDIGSIAAKAGFARAGAAARRQGGHLWTEASGRQVTLWLSIPKTSPALFVN